MELFYPRIQHFTPVTTGALLHDEYGKIWVQGLDYHQRLSSHGSKIDPRPFKTIVALGQDEECTKALHNTNTLAILTSKHKLYIAEVLDPQPTVDYHQKQNVIFVKVINGVLNVTLLGQTIFFKKNDSCCVYNHRLTRNELEPVLNDKMTLVPVIANGKIAYYRVDLDASYQVPITYYETSCLTTIYKRPFVHKGKVIQQAIPGNLVLLPTTDPSQNLADTIDYMNHICHIDKKETAVHNICNGSGYSHVRTYDTEACRYDDETGELVTIKQIGKPVFVNQHEYLHGHGMLVYIKDHVVYDPDGSVRLKLDSSTKIKYIVGICGSEFAVVEYRNRNKGYKLIGDVLCFAVKGIQWWYPMKVGILVHRPEGLLLATTKPYDSHILDKIEEITSPSGTIYYIYCVDIGAKIDAIRGESEYVIFCLVKYAKFARIEFSLNNPFAAWIMKLEPRTSPVISALIQYRTTGTITKSITDHELASFQANYLIFHDNHTSFNSDTLVVTGDDRALELQSMGHMLYAAISATKSHLSFRLPLAIVAGILGRDLTVAELEFFVKSTNPKTMASALICKTDSDALKDTGFDSYEQLLKALIHFDEGNTDCQAIARAFTEIEPIINLHMLNAPTLDAYISGPYEIDRLAIKSKLRGPEPVSFLVHEFLDEATEEEVRNLVRNWHGTLTNVQTYNMVHTNKINGLAFDTCTNTLQVHPKLIGLYENIRGVFEMLSSPITTITDSY